MYEVEAVLGLALGERLARSRVSLVPAGVVLDLVAMEGPAARVDWDSAFLDMAGPVSLGVGLTGSRAERAFAHLESMLPGAQLALLLEDLAGGVQEFSTGGDGDTPGGDVVSDGDLAPDGDAAPGPDGRGAGEPGVLVTAEPDALRAGWRGASRGSAGSSLVTQDPFVAVEMVAAWERLAAWAKAQSALAAARLAGLAKLNPLWPESAGQVAVPSVAGEELAMRLGCSRTAARELVALGQGFAGPLMPTGDAMLAGVIDLAKARVILKHLEDAPGQTAWGVQEVVLPGAGTRTPAQLAGDLRRALISIDPAEAEARRVRAVGTRRVCRPRALPDGMAGIWAVLPAPAAVQVDSSLDGLARSLRAGGDSRTLDQLRADIFAHTLVHQELLDTNPTLTGPTLTGPTLSDPAPADAATPDSNNPQKPNLADATSDDVGFDVLGSVEGAGGTGPCRCAAGVRGTAPPGATSHGTSVLGIGNGAGAGAGSGVGRGRRRTRPRRTRAPALINVTVSLSTLLGMDDAPGELAGYGAITAHAARELAAGGVWRRIVTDPLTGSAVDVGRTRYTPPASLVDHIRARDRVCARPGCSAPAASCDLDHTIEFTRADGTTSHTNLGPLCRRDHQIKTDGGFHLSQPEPGVFDWVTPTGHTYRVWPGDHGRYQNTSRPAYLDQVVETDIESGIDPAGRRRASRDAGRLSGLVADWTDDPDDSSGSDGGSDADSADRGSGPAPDLDPDPGPGPDQESRSTEPPGPPEPHPWDSAPPF